MVRSCEFSQNALPRVTGQKKRKKKKKREKKFLSRDFCQKKMPAYTVKKYRLSTVKNATNECHTVFA